MKEERYLNLKLTLTNGNITFMVMTV